MRYLGSHSEAKQVYYKNILILTRIIMSNEKHNQYIKNCGGLVYTLSIVDILDQFNTINQIIALWWQKDI